MEVVPVHFLREVFRSVELALDERFVDRKGRILVGDLVGSPAFNEGAGTDDETETHTLVVCISETKREAITVPHGLKFS
jgi:hypothetical protein